MSAKTKFYLDPQDGKIRGVCAGLADYSGVDVTWIRIAALALMFGAQQWWIIIAYFVLAKVAGEKPRDLYATQEDQKFWQGVRTNPKRSTGEVRSKLRDIDRRLADLETFYTSRNTTLSDEIERLR
jgi:phage shock protein C